MNTNKSKSILELVEDYSKSIMSNDYDETLKLNNQLYDAMFFGYLSYQKKLRLLNQKPLFIKLFYQIKIAKHKAQIKEITKSLEYLIKHSQRLIANGGNPQ